MYAVFSIASVGFSIFLLFFSHIGASSFVDAGSACIKGRCADRFFGWPDNELFWSLENSSNYYFTGSGTNYFPTFQQVLSPKYCLNTRGTTICRDNVGGRSPQIIDFSPSTTDVKERSEVDLRWIVNEAWSINVTSWCDYCGGNGNENERKIICDAKWNPHGSCTIQLGNSPTYYFKLFAGNGDGEVTSYFTLKPKDNWWNATTGAVGDAMNGVGKAFAGFFQKLADCAAEIGGDIAGEFTDIWKLAGNTVSYLLEVGQTASVASNTDIFNAACDGALVGVGAAGGAAFFGIGAAIGAPAMHAIASVTCPLLKRAAWTGVDYILCMTGIKNQYVNSKNIQLVFSVADFLSKVNWSDVGGFLKGIFFGKPTDFIPPPTTPLGVFSPPAGVPSDAVTIVGQGSASAGANALQTVTNQAGALVNPVTVDPASLSKIQQGALEVSGNIGKPLIQSGANMVTNIDAQAIERAGTSAEQIKSFFGTIGEHQVARLYSEPDHAKFLCRIIARDLNACP